jgi:hypothetical protein
MKLYITFLFILIFSFVGLAQKKSQNNNSIKEKEFDINAQSLPPNYKGNNFERLIMELSERERLVPTSKDEFETQKQFDGRVVKVRDAPYKSGLNSKSLYGFVLPDAGAKYSAESEEFTFEIHLYKKLNCKTTGMFWWTCKSLILHYKYTEKDSYIGENAFGVKTVVNAEHFMFLLLDLVTDDSMKPKGYESYTFDLKINSKPALARQLKAEFGVVAIGRLFDNDPLGADTIEVKPTRDSPTHSETNYLNLAFDLDALWLFNKRTGEVYSKLSEDL